MGKLIGEAFGAAHLEQMQPQTALMEEIVKDLPYLPALDSLDRAGAHSQISRQEVLGAALRALHSFLTQADPRGEWGGLRKTLTPDGTLLWLCETHRQPYEERLLAQQYLG